MDLPKRWRPNKDWRRRPPPGSSDTAVIYRDLSRYKAEVMELLRPGADGRSTEDWQVFVDERAGGAEFDGGLRALEPPREMREVIVLADGDDSGEAAARDCALRWKREGRRVPIARPPHGMDFNDVLKTSAPLTEEDA